MIDFFLQIFGRLLLNEMEFQGFLSHQNELSYHFFLKKLYPTLDPYNPCRKIEWFYELIFTGLSSIDPKNSLV